MNRICREEADGGTMVTGGGSLTANRSLDANGHAWPACREVKVPRGAVPHLVSADADAAARSKGIGFGGTGGPSTQENGVLGDG